MTYTSVVANKPPMQVSLSKEELKKGCGERCECTGLHKHRLSTVQREGFSNTELCQRQNEQPQSLKNWLSKSERQKNTRRKIWEACVRSFFVWFSSVHISYHHKATVEL